MFFFPSRCQIGRLGSAFRYLNYKKKNKKRKLEPVDRRRISRSRNRGVGDEKWRVGIFKFLVLQLINVHLTEPSRRDCFAFTMVFGVFFVFLGVQFHCKILLCCFENKFDLC